MGVLERNSCLCVVKGSADVAGDSAPDVHSGLLGGAPGVQHASCGRLETGATTIRTRSCSPGARYNLAHPILDSKSPGKGGCR